MARVFVALTALVALVSGGAAQDRQNVMLITFDGARVEEMFGGLDRDVFASTLGEKQQIEDQTAYRRFWASTPEERRERLMPFFWGTLMRSEGSIAGNRARGSDVHVVNRHWFSYPGYAEMLLGVVHDDTLTSNEAGRSPYPTVLEFLRAKLLAPPQDVAMFASWSVFNDIGESVEGAVTINAGLEPFVHPEPAIQALSAAQLDAPSPWGGIRHDVYTFRFAMAHLVTHKPRVLSLNFDETDDWAHDGRYDRVLEAYSRCDRYLEELWTWLQAQPEYRGRTSLLLTTDHGRGRTVSDWRHHGAKYPGAGDTWMAFVAPSMKLRGEWRNHAPLTTGQVAATLISWMGFDWRELNSGAAPPVPDASQSRD